jgi:hypothetical protein
LISYFFDNLNHAAQRTRLHVTSRAFSTAFARARLAPLRRVAELGVVDMAVCLARGK